eukprot:5240818-Alexandrium_andersonii.AAC.1
MASKSASNSSQTNRSLAESGKNTFQPLDEVAHLFPPILIKGLRPPTEDHLRRLERRVVEAREDESLATVFAGHQPFNVFELLVERRPVRKVLVEVAGQVVYAMLQAVGGAR